MLRLARGVDRAAGEAKEKDRALSGEAPTREGLAVGITARGVALVVVDRYHGVRESRWETVNEKREDVEPPSLAVVATTGSNRSDAALVRHDAKAASSIESSKSSDDTTAVTTDSSTKGRTPCTHPPPERRVLRQQ